MANPLVLFEYVNAFAYVHVDFYVLGYAYYLPFKLIYMCSVGTNDNHTYFQSTRCFDCVYTLQIHYIIVFFLLFSDEMVGRMVKMHRQLHKQNLLKMTTTFISKMYESECTLLFKITSRKIKRGNALFFFQFKKKHSFDLVNLVKW